MPGPTIVRLQRGAGHISVAIAHWAGGHTVSQEEITRRIVKARQDAHALAVAEAGRQAKTAHKKASRLRRISEQNGGLVPAQMTALATADIEAQRHDAAISALGEFAVPVLDPGHIRSRRHRIAAVRCVALTLPAGAIIAGSLLLDGTVFLWSVLGGLAACLARGDEPFELAVRPVPADLVAATPLVLPTATATVIQPGADPIPVDDGQWKTELRLYVEHAVAVADLEGRAGVHVADLLHGLQRNGAFLGFTTKTFPAKLKDAGIPYKVVKIKGDGQLGVRYDDLSTALGHQPTLPPALVPNLTEDEEVYDGGDPSPNPSPTSSAAAS